MVKKTELIHIDTETDFWQEHELIPVLVSKETLDELMDGRSVKWLEHGSDYIYADEEEE